MKNDRDKFIGNMIRITRKSAQLSQKVLADKLGITVQQISKYESGRNSITAANLQKIAEFFGCDVSFFFQKSKTLDDSLLKVAETTEQFFDKKRKDDDAILLLKFFFASSKEDKLKILKYAEKMSNKK